MGFEDRPQLALTTRRKVLSAAGALMWAALLIAAALTAPRVTGEGDANAAAVLGLWAAAAAWSVPATLLLVRQADAPDIFTAAFLIVISACALFALVAALDARGTEAERDVVDTMFFGVTTGALTGLLVGAGALLIARALRLPTSAAADNDGDSSRGE